MCVSPGMKCASGPTKPALLALGARLATHQQVTVCSELFGCLVLGLFWFFDFFVVVVVV